MKIFISWSGERSLGVATALREWLPYIFNGIELFVSSEDIRKGKRWPAEVSKELDVSNFGIVCLTNENLEAPWLLFEAGALSKSVKDASVYTLLVGGLRKTDVEGPLSHFQHTLFEKEDFFKLVRSINDGQPQGKQDEGRLRKIFEKFWDELESMVAKAVSVKAISKPEKTRSSEDMLRELLELTAHIARNMPEKREPPYPLDPVIEMLHTGGVWRSLLGKASPFVRSLLMDARNTVFTPDGTLTVLFDHSKNDHVKQLEIEPSPRIIRGILNELGLPVKRVAFGLVEFGVIQTPEAGEKKK